MTEALVAPVTSEIDLSGLVHACCGCQYPDGLTALCGTEDMDGWTTEFPNCPVCLDLMLSMLRCKFCNTQYCDLYWD